MLTVLPSKTCYHVNKPHVDLGYLNDTGFTKMSMEESYFAPSCLARSDLQSVLSSKCQFFLLITTYIR